MAKGHDLRVVTQDELQAPPVAHAELQARTVGLSWLDSMSACAFADGETAQLLDLIRDSAQALATDDSAARRLWAREVALAKAAVDLLVVSLGERIRADDGRGALLLDRGTLLLDRLATNATRRLVLLMGANPAARRPAMVAVGHADVVNIETEEPL